MEVFYSECNGFITVLFFHGVLQIITVVLNPILFQFITYATVTESVCLSIHNVMNFVNSLWLDTFW